LGVSLPEPGLYRLEASFAPIEGPDLEGRQDLLLVEGESPFRDILWGDIHAHSALSDGTGHPEDLYAFAREVAGLDVCSVTDHDAHGLFPLVESGGWETVRRATAEAYRPGEFVTLLGWEWTSWTWGHRNVYYPGAEGDVFEHRAPESDTPEELWASISAFGGMTIPHHPAGGPIAIDWSVPSDEELERVVEICSIHGSSEFPGAERAIYRPVDGAFVRDAFNRGHRLGILASGDTHDGRPGLRSVGAPTNGLAAFRTGERTRDAVFRSIRERRVYGTSGARILLAGRWGSAAPGSVLDARPEGPIVVDVVAPEPIELIEVVGPDGPVATEYGGGRRVRRRFGDLGPETVAWLYVRVVLADGETAWDSPWWLPEPTS
jgi:histidinol phosphatase-like PHP family hydrolase